jgi:hypothetical protein
LVLASSLPARRSKEFRIKQIGLAQAPE